MSQSVSAWNLRNVSPEARAAAKQAAADAGLPLGTWLGQLIRKIDAHERTLGTAASPSAETVVRHDRLSSIERAMLQNARPARDFVPA